MSSYYEKMLATGEVKCIDDEIPFEIPKGWEWVHLETILNIGSARRVHAKDWRTVGIPFYRAREIGKLADDGFVDNELYIDQSLYEEFSSSGIPLPKDLMVTAVGTLGKVYIVKDKDKFYYKDGSVLCLANKYGLCAEYLKMVIESPSFKMQYKQESQGTTVATLTMVRLQKYFIPLPPLQEQYRIVKKLAELLPQIDKYSKVQNQLDELNTTIKGFIRKSILQEAIQGKLVPQIAEEGTAQELLEQIKTEKQKLVKEGKLKKSALASSVIFRGDDNKYYEQIGSEVTEIELPFDFPSTWSIARLNAVCQLTDGLKTIGKQCLLDAKYLRGKSSETIVEQGKLVYKGDNIMLVDGENSGEVFIVPQDGYMGSTFKQLWISSPMYEPYVLAFIQFYKETLRNSKKGAAIPHLNKELFYGLIIGIPPLQEQRRIVQKIEQSSKLLK